MFCDRVVFNAHTCVYVNNLRWCKISLRANFFKMSLKTIRIGVVCVTTSRTLLNENATAAVNLS